MKQSISVTVINVNINCKNGINVIFSPKTAFFTVGVAHTTPLYKGAPARLSAGHRDVGVAANSFIRIHTSE